MKKNLLRHLTRPVRSPLHSSPVCSQRIEACREHLFRSVRRHRSVIMFGMLVVVFRGDCVAVLGFSSMWQILAGNPIDQLIDLATEHAMIFAASSNYIRTHPGQCNAARCARTTRRHRLFVNWICRYR
jgi:hypothetical protein